MPTLIAAATFAPDAIPAKMPSSVASRLAICIASADVIRIGVVKIDRSKMFGMKPVPIPEIYARRWFVGTRDPCRHLE